MVFTDFIFINMEGNSSNSIQNILYTERKEKEIRKIQKNGRLISWVKINRKRPS